jgi:protein TonB
MILTVNHDGRVLGTEIVQGSGNSRLDRQAEAIAVGAAGRSAASTPKCARRQTRSPWWRASSSPEQTLETNLETLRPR